MIINSIVIYDYIKNKINQFNFGPQTNILVSETNKVGKSSLIKSLYFSLGYGVKIWPQDWDIQNMMFQINITNKNRQHTVTRHKNLFYIDSSSEVLNEKDYSKWLQDLLDIEIKLKDKKEKLLSDVYASEVLLPFYIDQDKSWNGYLYSKSSDSFARYSSTVKSIFDFYFQISDEILIDLELQKSVIEAELSNTQKKIEAFTLLISEHAPSLYTDTKIINKENVAGFTVKYLEKINRLNNTVSPINNQIIEIESKINELSRDISELDKLKKAYGFRISEIKYECIHCNSKLTVEQSLTRLKIRNNLYEIVNRMNQKKNDRTKLEKQKDNILVNKEVIMDTILKNDEIVQETKDFNSIETYIEEQVTQKVAYNFMSIEEELINEQYKKSDAIKEISKQIAKVKKIGNQKKVEVKGRYLELINEYERHLKDVKLDDIEFYNFKEVNGSGMDSNTKLLALYTLYSNLLDEFANVKIPFAMDSFIKNESSSDLKEKMFGFLSKYYLSIDGQTFFSIIKENVGYLGPNNYHFVDLEKPILKDIDETNENLIKLFDSL
ncbi:hypothetical protein P4H27_00255 [Paenibacillus taichungensis]|uniref:hypothetical protein n=1 Tax=Paenibacillus taichungensis TaxID=484184 RepID=UPI002DB6762C|nr:hypothetical protein [Paenibacillus taichungensis]MEC0105363.1 hypothetical protein [Paenibacillus taichungensis]MEC0200438.1 hypothetical protein [Paenibacillus taichungensis]